MKRKMRHAKNTNPNLNQKEIEQICDKIQKEFQKYKTKEEIKEKKLDLSSSDKILENLTLSIDNLSTQINLLREDLRPERRKSEIFKGKYMTEEEERERIRIEEPQKIDNSSIIGYYFLGLLRNSY